MDDRTVDTSVERMVFRVAGLLILVSLGMAQIHSVYWLWLTGFVGVNLLQASFTRFCPLAIILKKLGLQPGSAF